MEKLSNRSVLAEVMAAKTDLWHSRQIEVKIRRCNCLKQRSTLFLTRWGTGG
jgi:hypothetical protein